MNKITLLFLLSLIALSSSTKLSLELQNKIFFIDSIKRGIQQGNEFLEKNFEIVKFINFILKPFSLIDIVLIKAFTLIVQGLISAIYGLAHLPAIADQQRREELLEKLERVNKAAKHYIQNGYDELNDAFNEVFWGIVFDTPYAVFDLLKVVTLEAVDFLSTVLNPWQLYEAIKGIWQALKQDFKELVYKRNSAEIDN